MVKEKTKSKSKRTKKTIVKKSKTVKKAVRTRKVKKVVKRKSIRTRKLAKIPEQPQIKRLYRSENERILGGVCGGIAEYFGVDPTLIRLPWVFASFAWGMGLILYILAWVIIPKNPKHKWG